MLPDTAGLLHIAVLCTGMPAQVAPAGALRSPPLVLEDQTGLVTYWGTWGRGPGVRACCLSLVPSPVPWEYAAFSAWNIPSS